MTRPAAIPQADMDRALSSCVKNGIPVRRIVFDMKQGRVTVEVGEPEGGEATGYETVNWEE